MEEPDVDQQQLGASLLSDGDVAAAIVAFRRWAYLAPDDPSAHFHLGLALDRAEQHRSAGRAYRAALSALDRSDAAQIVALLDGYDRAEFRRLLLQRGAVSDRAPAPIHTEKLEAKR
jgi:chemotaxis protein methyltransferase CheR